MKIIEEELNLFDKKLSECFSYKHTEISDDIKNFIFAKSKKLRPKLIFLFTKALSENITEEISPENDKLKNPLVKFKMRFSNDEQETTNSLESDENENNVKNQDDT